MSVKKIAYIGIITALMLILSLIESFMPPIIAIVPFAKIGLANLIVMFALCVSGFYSALILTMIKCFFLAVYSGNFSSLLYSVPSSLVSLIIAGTCYVKFKSTLPFASSVAAVFHNLMQTIIAALITGTNAIFIYLPILVIVGAISGLALGVLDVVIIKKLPMSLLDGITQPKIKENTDLRKD